MSASRPRFNAEIAKLAATEIVNKLIAARLIGNSEREQAIADVAKHADRAMGGYEIAKRLDDCENWDCDFRIAEVLDGFASAADHALTQAQKGWADGAKPKPPLPNGTRLRLKRGEFGTIDCVATHHVASYMVKVDGAADHSRRIIKFEDATAAHLAEAV